MPKLAIRPRLRLLEAAATPHGLDSYLEQVDPLLVLGECRAEVVAVERGTEESVTLTLRPNRAWKGFRAGQFVNVAVEIDGVRHQRCYSPACVEHRRRDENRIHRPVFVPSAGKTLELTVKRHSEGLISGFLVDRAEPGMVVGLSAGEGDFQLPDPRPDSVLLIGGGSGITPLMAILRTLFAEGYGGPVALIYYAPDAERCIYREELERLAAAHSNFRLLRSYTRAPGAGELDGHFSPAHLPQSDPDFTQAETFACGPPALLDAVRGTWANGLEQRLHVESFVPPTFVPVGEPGEGQVLFADSGVEVANSGESLLVQAEAAGLTPEYGCRMGICHTCT
ncbi:MAG TPA: 2Fe-2S iron-sulfur cluster-binding protein, partial [Solirubrobacterales bacterium]|nr:2Fe-2S iron-sulfur cluster-binding protein [Solirubrobacterales bacterium]